MMASTPTALLTPKQAAAALAISQRKLWELSNCGKIPVVRLGRCVRYDPADLARFVEAQKTGGGRHENRT